jgi:hypothetical protein
MGHGGPRRAADALQPQLGLGPLNRVAAGWCHYGAEAEPEAEEVLEGDRLAAWRIFVITALSGLDLAPARLTAGIDAEDHQPDRDGD